mmetsp:Transcript_38722/g.90700  ORF Transcript_38722/g.90700 Transcript_38722/m.90700 type:complete len:417 (+) Transcript_38722:728-1978(+)
MATRRLSVFTVVSLEPVCSAPCAARQGHGSAFGGVARRTGDPALGLFDALGLAELPRRHALAAPFTALRGVAGQRRRALGPGHPPRGLPGRAADEGTRLAAFTGELVCSAGRFGLWRRRGRALAVAKLRRAGDEATALVDRAGDALATERRSRDRVNRPLMRLACWWANAEILGRGGRRGCFLRPYRGHKTGAGATVLGQVVGADVRSAADGAAGTALVTRHCAAAGPRAIARHGCGGDQRFTAAERLLGIELRRLAEALVLLATDVGRTADRCAAAVLVTGHLLRAAHVAPGDDLVIPGLILPHLAHGLHRLGGRAHRLLLAGTDVLGAGDGTAAAALVPGHLGAAADFGAGDRAACDGLYRAHLGGGLATCGLAEVGGIEILAAGQLARGAGLVARDLDGTSDLDTRNRLPAMR